jgi:hypothetical protein
MRKTTFVWLFILIAGPLLAQEDVLKDLLAQLKQPQSDTTRALLQCEVAWELQGGGPRAGTPLFAGCAVPVTDHRFFERRSHRL